MTKIQFDLWQIYLSSCDKNTHWPMTKLLQQYRPCCVSILSGASGYRWDLQIDTNVVGSSLTKVALFLEKVSNSILLSRWYMYCLFWLPVIFDKIWQPNPEADIDKLINVVSGIFYSHIHNKLFWISVFKLSILQIMSKNYQKHRKNTLQRGFLAAKMWRYRNTCSSVYRIF